MLAAQGDAIMVIDADLQDPPELIPTFVARWLEGYDIVYGVREKRPQGHFFPRFFFGARIVPRHVGAPHLQM